MIVGEAPGAEEERLGRPFVGRSGELLNLALNRTGRSRHDAYITNVYKTRPPDNRTPTEDEIDQHRIFLECEIGTANPKYILALGAVALYALTGLEGITKRRGSWYHLELDDSHSMVLPTFHPAYVLRNRPVREEIFINDVRHFFNQ